MSFEIALDKYERAHGALVRAVQAAFQATFAEEARDRGLTQDDIARELGISASVVSRRLNALGNVTLRSVSDMYVAMGREPLSGFHAPEPKHAQATFPIGSARIEPARDVSGRIIGVSITLLVPHEHINDLPRDFAHHARATLAESCK